MAALLARASPSLLRVHSHAASSCSGDRLIVRPSACFKHTHVFPIRWRSRLIPSSESRNEKVLDQSLLTLATSDNEILFPLRLLEHGKKVTSIASLGAASFLASLPANAAFNFADPITEETLPSFLITITSAVVIAFVYFIVIPLVVYYYLYKRWFKRKMVEAIFQFGLVFLFFPGMLLLAPFINFRGAPQEGAKEPWDEIRPE